MQVVNTHFPGIPAMPGVRALFCVVLAQDAHGARLYTCYAGLVLNREQDSIEWVRDRGTKLRWTDAVTHFPSIKEEQYRG